MTSIRALHSIITVVAEEFWGYAGGFGFTLSPPLSHPL